jgi:hypothetical protein
MADKWIPIVPEKLADKQTQIATYKSADARAIQKILSKYIGKTVGLFGGDMWKDYNIEDVGVLKNVQVEENTGEYHDSFTNTYKSLKGTATIIITMFVKEGSTIFYGSKTITPHFGSWRLAVKR